MENDRTSLKTTFSLPGPVTLRPHWYSHAAKRPLDLLAAGLGLLLLSPFLCRCP